MVSIYLVEVTIVSASGLKNLNSPDGDLKPYAVAWIDPAAKGTASTNIDCHRNTNPVWNEKHVIPLVERPIDDATLFFEVYHAINGTKPLMGATSLPLVGSATLPLRNIIWDAGIGHHSAHTLQLKNPSSGHQGKLEIKVIINDPFGFSKPAPMNEMLGTRGFSGGPTEHPASAAQLPPDLQQLMTLAFSQMGGAPHLQRIMADAYLQAVGSQPHLQPAYSQAAGAQPWVGAQPNLQQLMAGVYSQAAGAQPWLGAQPHLQHLMTGAYSQAAGTQPWAGAYGSPSPSGASSSYLKYGAKAAGLLLNMMNDPSGTSALFNLFNKPN